MDKREKLAREMMLHAEQRFDSARGRELLGFQTLEGFIDDGWRNYLPYVDIALADGSKPAVDLEAVNRALAATVRKQEEEIKAANAEITRLRHNIRAEASDMLHGTPCAEIRWQQERETLVADNERLRAALEPFAKAAESFAGMPIKNPEEWFAYRGVNAGGEVSGAITIGDLRRARAAIGGAND